MVLIIINILSALLTVAYLILVFSFLKGWKKITYKQPSLKEPITRVSIIIAARNEEKNIDSTLQALLKQDYPEALFEITVINDHSTDNTASLVAAYADKGVRLINLTDAATLNSYKKAAIQLAIAETTGDLIVTTDADCVMGKRWLSTIVGFYEQNNYQFISCPVAYHKEKSFFERLQSLEFLYLIGLGAASIGNSHPSTCNGANLAYSRKVFMEVDGFKGIDDLASGDDELLLHKIIKKYPEGIGFLKQEDAIVYTMAKPTVEEFMAQRKRWASKMARYENRSMVFVNITIWLFNVSILIQLAGSIFNIGFLYAVLLQLLLKLTIELLFLNEVTAFFKHRRLLIYLPLLTILHAFYLVYIGIAGSSGTYQWKGRTVR